MIKSTRELALELAVICRHELEQPEETVTRATAFADFLVDTKILSKTALLRGEPLRTKLDKDELDQLRAILGEGLAKFQRDNQKS